MLFKIRVSLLLLVIAFCATAAAAQETAARCAETKYAQLSPSHKSSKVYRLERVEGQTVYAPISQKWDSGTDGVCLAVFNEQDGKQVAAVWSHDGGQFQIPNLNPGQYVLIAAVDALQEIVIPILLKNAGAKKNVTPRLLLLHMRLKEDKRKSFVNLITYPALRAQLLQMVQQDQEIRLELIKGGVDHPQPEVERRMAVIDERNTRHMKAIVDTYGWPDPEAVGLDGAEAAFLVVQHADHSFQFQMLPRVMNAFRAGKLSGPNYALLLDRVLVGDGRPQIYGTQAKPFDQWKGKEPVVYPVVDEINVDKRRAEVGLGPLAEYLKGLGKLYFPDAKE
ncbi:MAG: hypothetical protein QOD75_2539 [Blastocatellia bacterium]|jgi:hypothetical protein|nr:hypothetical protein [Blastocatellia bacterium]